VTTSAREWRLPALVCAALAILHTWPLASSPALLSRNDNGDAQLNEWILAWIAHALARDPLHLFQANIFYPARDALAFSEPLIVPALLGAPVAWLGGSPVLVFNLMVIAGFALTAMAGYILMFAWTRDRTAALLTGSAVAFNTHTLTRLAHVQALHLYGLPLALLFTDRLIAGGSRRDAAWLALWISVLACTSGYLFVFAVVMIAIVLLVRAGEWTSRAGVVLGRFALASILSAAAVVPLAIPYQRAAREQGMVRSLDSVAEFSAVPRGYLAAAGTIHMQTWSARFFRDPVDSFFPGFVLIALSSAAVWLVARRAEPLSGVTRPRVAMLVALAVAGFVLSLGTQTPVYGWLYRALPPMHGLRAAARFGNLFLLAMAVLAGLGLAALRASHPRSRTATIAAALLVIAVNVEALRAPFEYRRFGGIPNLYSLLRDEPRVVLAEVPFYPPQAVFENAEYVLNSTAHWRPLMNGYSGYTPATYVEYAAAFRDFPSDSAIDGMRRAGVTHVMVHPTRFAHDAAAVLRELERRPEFELMGVGARGLRLYRLR
jgi:hypothetical protein